MAIVKGIRTADVSSVLLKLPRRLRYRVKEITLDMAPSMEKIARECFPGHQLVHEAVQDLRLQISRPCRIQLSGV